MRNRTAAFRCLDLTEIASEVFDLFEPTAEESMVRLRLASAEPVSMVGDRDLLFDALSNIVDNAIRYGGAGGEVIISVSHNGDGPMLSVADRGPGIPRDERALVVQRLYRLEHSRNTPGNGLGLSLVAAVAGLHGARLEMTDNGPGLKIAMHFPNAETWTSPVQKDPSALNAGTQLFGWASRRQQRDP
jgi:signal transduction histidine kinase